MPILLNQNIAFPDPGLADAEGLVAIGGDLGTERLLAAYRVRSAFAGLLRQRVED